MKKFWEKKKLIFESQKRKQLIFYILVLAIPVVQFCIFYIGVNINSILLAFKQYDIKTGYTFCEFENFKTVFSELFNVENESHELIMYAIKNSLTLGFLTIFIGTTLSVVFSYFIYKKWFASEVFKIFLFLPNMISSVVLVIIFKKFCDSALPEAFAKLFDVKIMGLLSNNDTKLITIMIYTLFVGFGTQIMMYSGAMSSVSDSIVEAGELDGCNAFDELFHIIIPSIYSTIVTFTIVSVATIFVNQMNLFSFYGPSAYSSNPKIISFGYFLYKEAYAVELAKMPRVSSYGILLTLVSIPITYLVKFLMERFGPSVD